MAQKLHSLDLVLAVDQFGHVLPDAVEEELVLLLLNAGDGELAEDLIDCLELTLTPHVFVGLVDHLFQELVFLGYCLAVLFFYHN